MEDNRQLEISLDFVERTHRRFGAPLLWKGSTEKTLRSERFPLCNHLCFVSPIVPPQRVIFQRKTRVDRTHEF